MTLQGDPAHYQKKIVLTVPEQFNFFRKYYNKVTLSNKTQYILSFRIHFMRDIICESVTVRSSGMD